MVKVKESWLRSLDENNFAAAMERCKHPFALCAQDGFCHYGGECFRNQLEEWLATSSDDVLLREKQAIDKELQKRKKALLAHEQIEATP